MNVGELKAALKDVPEDIRIMWSGPDGMPVMIGEARVRTITYLMEPGQFIDEVEVHLSPARQNAYPYRGRVVDA